MTTKVILYFPSDATDKAVTYDLVKRYDLRINILRAEIEAGRSGSLLVELTGEESMVREGVAYLERNGVTVSPVASKIAYDRDRHGRPPKRRASMLLFTAYPYTPIKSSFEDAGSVEDMMLCSKL